MLTGHIDTWTAHQDVLSQPLWSEVFTWLKAPQVPPDGEYELRGHHFRALVQTVACVSRDTKSFEAHRRELDVHYCVSGSEQIEWAPLHLLTARTGYDHERDFTLYDPLPEATSLYLTPGRFAIFWPEDGHMPGIRAADQYVRKVIFKVDVSLLG